MNSMDLLLIKVRELESEVKRYENWVADLHSGMYVNCVYCGHRYGPEDEVSATMAEALTNHIENCPKHPMSALKKENFELKEMLMDIYDKIGTLNHK